MLQGLAEEWRVRVLTPYDIASLVHDGFVSPMELPNKCTPDEKFVMSMLRLTEHSSRCKFLGHCLDYGVLGARVPEGPVNRQSTDDVVDGPVNRQRRAYFRRLVEDVQHSAAGTYPSSRL